MKMTVCMDKGLRRAAKNGELAQNPKAFRHIMTVFPFLVEAALTGQQKIPILAPVVDREQCVNIAYIAVHEQASMASRVRCSIQTGLLGHLALSARIDFMSGNKILSSFEAAADSDGLRFLRPFKEKQIS